MYDRRKVFSRLLWVCAALSSSPSWATNGYFSHGYGIKSKGMAGASVADTDHAFAGATNPAAAGFAGDRMEVGMDYFAPDRDATVGSTKVRSGNNAFFVPELGYNRKVSESLGVGVAVFGNGGMNATYEENLMDGTGKLGVDLMQLIVAPTLAYRFDARHAFGVSPLLIYQQFEAYGLQAYGFATNPGKDSSTGLGVRLGYAGQLSESITVGASYSPKIDMSRFEKYEGFFAGKGDFDIPANYSMGMSFKPVAQLTIAACYQRIDYSGVPAIANSSTSPGGFGAADGPGFGWKDVNVYRLGAQYQVSPVWTLRAGVNHGDNPVRSEDVGFNILAPGVVQRHYTVGGTYTLGQKDAISFAFMHAARNEVSGTMMTQVGGVPASIGMSQNSFGLQYGRRF